MIMNNKYLALILLLVIGLTAFAPFINATPTQITTELFLSQDHYYQRHSWYSNGRFWVLYGQVDGVNEYVYQSSLDGITWLPHTQIVTSEGICYTQRCDVALASDGTTIHVVMALKSSGIPYTHYKKGTCNADGTITWAGAGDSLPTSGTEHSIALDSQDYPTILMNYNNELNLRSYRSTTKAGLFDEGPEGAEEIGSGTDIEGKALSIGGQNLYVVYTKTNDGGKLYGKTFSFATKTWGAEETITTTNVNAYSFSLVSDGSIVYLAWREQATCRAYGAIRSALGVWTELGDLGGEAVTGTPSVTLDSNFGGAWVLWANAATNIKIRHIDTDGTLSTAKAIKSKGVAVVETGLIGLEVMEVTNDLNHLGIVYPTATGTSFDLLSIYSDFYITNMEGSDAYGDGLKLIAVEEKFYNFQLDVTGIIADPVTYASIRFYNNGNLIQVDYNATTALTTVIAGNDYIMLHETLTSTSGDTISIIWSIWLKSTCLDKEDLDIQTYFSLESGANIGWETYPSYCDLYNLGGWVSTTASGASTTVVSTTYTIQTTSITQSSITYYTTSLTTPSSTVLTTSVSTSTVITTSGAVTTTTLTCTTQPLTSTTARTTSTTVYSTSTISSTMVTTTKSTLSIISGAGGKTTGGDLFDLYVYPNSMVKGQIAFRNLQNVHALINVYADKQVGWDEYELTTTAPLYFGLDYWTGTEYVDGYYVKLTLASGYLSDSDRNTLLWLVEWYVDGVQVGEDQSLYTYPQYNANGNNDPVSTSFILDMWMNKQNSSSVYGGRITAEYNAMVNNANPWIRWLTGGSWGPVIASEQVMFFHNIQNGAHTTISAKDIEMSYFWVRMTQDNNAYGIKYFLKDWDVLDFGVTKGEMIGINTPSFIKTKIPNMAQTGFLNSLWASLQQSFEGIISAFSGVAGWLGLAMFNFVDSILAYFGLSGAFRTIVDTILTAWTATTAYIISSVTLILKSFEIITITFGYIIFVFTNFTNTAISIITIVVGIFNGTYTIGGAAIGVLSGLGNMWTSLNLATAFPLITIWIIMDWLGGLKGSFGQVFRQAYDDIKTFLGVTLGVAEFVINIFYMLVVNLINFITGLMAAVN
jgi:hypothetical protein